MNYSLLRLAAAMAILLFGAAARAQSWSSKDVGNVGKPGSMSYVSASGSYSLNGAGLEIGGSADSFAFFYQVLSGDGQIVARLAQMANFDAGGRCGLMIRGDLTPGSPNVFVGFRPSAAGVFQRRTSANGSTITLTVADLSTPQWFKLARKGASLQGSVSTDGATWHVVGEAVLALPVNALIGLAVSSGNTARVASATFDGVMKVQSLLPTDVPSAGKFYASTGATLTRATANDSPGGQVLRVANTQPPSKPSDVRLKFTNTVAISDGDVLLATCFARSTKTTPATLALNCSPNTAVEPVSLLHEVSIGSDWQRISVPFVMRGSYKAGAARFEILLGYGQQTVELAGIELSDFGQALISPPDSVVPTFTGSSYGSFQAISVTGQPFAKAYRVTTNRRAPGYSDIGLTWRLPAPIQAGDTLYLTAWTRANNTSQTQSRAKLVLEQNGAGKALNSWVESDRVWKKTMMPLTATTTLSAGQARFEFNCGFDPQSVEIGGLKVVNLGRVVPAISLNSNVSYLGREATAAWRAPAETRIEQIRKAPLTVVLTDPSGQPVRGAGIRIEMLEHAFGFGAAVNASTLISNPPTGISQADADTFREALTSNFNAATLGLDLKWPDWVADRTRGIRALDWLIAHGIDRVRGHTLVWPAWANNPSKTAGGIKLQSLSNAALAAEILTHIQDEAGDPGLRGRLTDWDVINESFASRDFMNRLGDAAMSDWLRAAHAADADALIYLNDFNFLENFGLNTNVQDYYLGLIRSIQAQGIVLDGLGMQCHFGWDVPGPQKILEVLNRYSTAFPGLRLAITEYDIDIADEQLQADFLRDFLTVAFSHPSLDQFILWGFWDGKHGQNNAPLFHKDWSIKAAGKVWQELIYRRWWTNLQGATDSQGAYSSRVFLGRHRVTVTSSAGSLSREVEVTRDGEVLELSLPR